MNENRRFICNVGFSFNIPHDVLETVFTFLDIHSLLSCELVSTTWRRCTPSAWTKLLGTPCINYLLFKRRKRLNETMTDKQICVKTLVQRSKGLLVLGGSFGVGNEINYLFQHIEDTAILGGPVNHWDMPVRGLGSIAATESNDGNIEMFGGWNQKLETSLDTSYYLNTENRDLEQSMMCSTQWNLRSHQLPLSACYSSAGCLIGGEVVLLGGGSSPYRYADVYTRCFIRQQTGPDATWDNLPGMLVPRCGHSSVVTFNNQVVVFGGYSGGTLYQSSGEIFDFGSCIWSPLPSMPVARSGFTAALDPYGGVIVAGGSSDGTIGLTTAGRLGNIVSRSSSS